MSELDNLLDITLDDLADLPSFKPFPVGVHRVLATMEADEISVKMKKPCVELSFTYLECLELADPTEEAPKEGDTANTMFMLDNEFGQGAFKLCATPLGAALGTKSGRDTVDQCTDVECVIITAIQVDKKDATKLYLKVKELQVV
jgi:hypothetical protein